MNKRVTISMILIILISFFLTFLYFYSKKEEKTEYKGKYEIVNKTEKCDEELFEIGKDHTYIYYLKCANPKKVFLVFENKSKMRLSDALKENYISLKEIEQQMKENLFIESINKEKALQQKQK